MIFRCLLFPLLLVLISSQTFDDASNEILVLLNNYHLRDAYSNFLNSFKDRGFNLRYKACDDPNLTITRHGDYAYKYIILLCPNVRSFGGKVDVKTLVKFMNGGGNLMITGDSTVGEAIRHLSSEMGAEFDMEGSSLVDNFNYEISDLGDHTRVLVPSENLIDAKVMVGERSKRPLLYQGVGITFPPSNILLTDVLHGDKTSYCYNPHAEITDYPNCMGNNAKLIVALQARNNARVLMLGSVKFLSDEFMNIPVQFGDSKIKSDSTSNKEVAIALGKWLTHESGQLRVKKVNHHKVNEKYPPVEYTINEDVHFAIEIEELDGEGKWIPYVADDVQMSLIRMDPFVRKMMKHTGNQYSLTVKIPDIYGVFKFVVDYHHTGYTYLESITEISVRPLKHTQYERFIHAANPYYASAFSMMVSLFLFSFVFLYTKESETDKKKTD